MIRTKRPIRTKSISPDLRLGFVILLSLAAPTASAQSGVACWGDNSAGECDTPPLPPGRTYVDISAGETFTLALQSDGSGVAWGWNGIHAVPALPRGQAYVEIEGGGAHAVALRSDGSVVAWGNNWFGQCDVPPLPTGLTYVEIAAGGESWNLVSHTLARRSDGSVVGWGDSAAGQDVPPLPPGLTYVEIAAAYYLSVARRSDGSVVVWGGCSSGDCLDVPALPAGLTYTGVAAGYEHVVALRSDGSVVAWGLNFWGQCDVPALPAGLRYVEVAAGYSHSVARYEGCPTCELPFCLGDGGSASVPCPCGNDGSSGRGCQNSAATGGAKLTADGSVVPDRVVLLARGELDSALSVFLQGRSVLGSPASFGDGVRCIGGTLDRICVKTAVAGAASYPELGDPSISTRSLALGDLIRPGTFRYYQVYYRDPDAGFCNPSATFNASNAVMVRW